MVTDGQVRKLFRDLDSDQWLAVAARRAGMDEKTARKYHSLGGAPEHPEAATHLSHAKGPARGTVAVSRRRPEVAAFQNSEEIRLDPTR